MKTQTFEYAIETQSKVDRFENARGGVRELMDRRGCAILAPEVVPKNLIFA